MAVIGSDAVSILRNPCAGARWQKGTKLYAQTPLIDAAPEMLEALKIAAMALDLAALVPGNEYWQEQGRAAARTAREAISKALSEEE